VTLRSLVKYFAYLLATVVVAPALFSYALRALILGKDRALEGSSQMIGLVPGLVGQYLRRAFYRQVLADCDIWATIEFGTLFSAAGAKVGKHSYIGPRCHIGLAHIGAEVLIGPAVHIPSGAMTHGTGDLDRPLREQEGSQHVVRIGDGCWIGSAAIVMADVGAQSIVGAGAVVTKPIPARVMAAGVPCRVIRER
jgi:acetyltransferase-like isoleucine patch superfamily enzyme